MRKQINRSLNLLKNSSRRVDYVIINRNYLGF